MNSKADNDINNFELFLFLVGMIPFITVKTISNKIKKLFKKDNQNNHKTENRLNSN